MELEDLGSSGTAMGPFLKDALEASHASASGRPTLTVPHLSLPWFLRSLGVLRQDGREATLVSISEVWLIATARDALPCPVNVFLRV